MPKVDLKEIAGAHKSPLPRFIPPQLATLVKEPPAGDEWLHELKFDGYRMLGHISRGNIRFWSRNRKDWTAKFPNLAKVLKSFPASTAVLDGEIVIMDAAGRSSFQKLQEAMGKSSGAVFVFQVFDLLYLDGYNLTAVPLRERKRLLRKLFDSVSTPAQLCYSDHIEGNGAEFLKQACEFGVEGIVSKLGDSPYESTRSRNWQKTKCAKNQEFVICGYTPSAKGLPGFGSLILGVYARGNLVYAGRVGTGFSFKERLELARKLNSIVRDASPFAVTPKDPGLREAHWAQPKLIAEVSFTEWTSDGSIRHPSFQGLREDKSASEVRRELPASGPGKRKPARAAKPSPVDD